MNVLIIPEDFRKDQYLLQPIIQRMMEEVGKPKAKVKVCLDPLLGGVGEAMKWTRLSEIIGMYPMVQLFLLIVDRDGLPDRRKALTSLEVKATEVLNSAQVFLAENAWQEIEVWALAAAELPSEWRWQDIRNDRDPKERYFAELARTRKLDNEPGEGRTTLGREAARNYKRMLSLCKEDVVALQTRIEAWLQSKI
jgi:hypothetical protein